MQPYLNQFYDSTPPLLLLHYVIPCLI